ncbi:hypothetical protein HK101_002087 [Irineochytrium annulatum]|nr:hypothetical protein HK101_002087 [Irineochytrium annulatum]
MGIVGLPNVGKSAFFNVLTASSVPSENFPFCTIDPSEARVNVADPRLETLATMYKPKAVIPAFLTVVDIAGLVKGAAASGEGIGNKFLSDVQAADGLYHLIRGFKSPDVIHVEGSVDAVRDCDIIKTELRLKDAEQVATMRAKRARAVTSDRTGAAAMEVAIYDRVTGLLLEENMDVRDVEWSVVEAEVLNRLALLTAKPVVYLVNVSEEDFAAGSCEAVEAVRAHVRRDDPVLAFSAELEEMLAMTEGEEEKMEYLASLGHNVNSALDDIVLAGYKAMGLEYFFTAGPMEVRAWTFKSGSKCPQAAAVIHSDFEKAFVAAEVMRFEDLRALGSEDALKKEGRLVTKGKDGIIQVLMAPRSS